MKTTTIILAGLFTLQTSLLFAGNETVTPNTARVLLTPAALAPVPPAEATFEDFPEPAEPALLAPITPPEAGFEDTAEIFPDLSGMAPSTPGVADFGDAPEPGPDFSLLPPVPPAEADFEAAL